MDDTHGEDEPKLCESLPQLVAPAAQELRFLRARRRRGRVEPLRDARERLEPWQDNGVRRRYSVKVAKYTSSVISARRLAALVEQSPERNRSATQHERLLDAIQKPGRRKFLTSKPFGDVHLLPNSVEVIWSSDPHHHRSAIQPEIGIRTEPEQGSARTVETEHLAGQSKGAPGAIRCEIRRCVTRGDADATAIIRHEPIIPAGPILLACGDAAQPS
jgi:hypothetical protein